MQPANQHNQSKMKANKKPLLLVIVTLIAVGAAGFFAYKYQAISNNPQQQLEQKNSTETKEVIDALSKIIALPTDKQPTVAKVEDAETLKKTNQTFYKDISQGDYLVLYTDRAIIFRKQENKVINVAPIVDSSKISPQNNSEDAKNKSNWVGERNPKPQ